MRKLIPLCVLMFAVAFLEVSAQEKAARPAASESSGQAAPAMTPAQDRRASLLPGAEVSGRRLLLVDDVVTSGATLGECAFLLRQAGAEKVWCVTLAQAGREKEKGKDGKN